MALMDAHSATFSSHRGRSPELTNPAPPAASLPSEPELDPLLRETNRHLRSLGRINILVAGQTGVGKSTLINSIFGESFAATAAGRPRVE